MKLEYNIFSHTKHNRILYIDQSIILSGKCNGNISSDKMVICFRLGRNCLILMIYFLRGGGRNSSEASKNEFCPIHLYPRLVNKESDLKQGRGRKGWSWVM